MGDRSGIAWTDATANVVVGCSRVSEGCRHCYAEALAATRLKRTKRYEGLAIVTESGKPQWTGKARLSVDAIEQVIRWQKPRRIFLTAMGDPFHESLSNEQIAALFGLMAVCPQHTFQVLTKRAKRMREWFGWAAARIVLDGEDGRWTPFVRELVELLDDAKLATRINEDGIARAPSDEAWPLPNVWLGVSVEDQRAADERIPELLSTPAAVRFLSCEPLLGPVDLATPPARCEQCPGGGEIVYDAVAGQCADCGSLAVYWSWLKSPDSGRKRTGIDWVIVGGESGHNARPFDLAWARAIVEQCKSAEVPVFCKQLGAKPVDSNRMRIIGPQPWRAAGHEWFEFDMRVEEQRAIAADVAREPGYKLVPALLLLGDSHGADTAEWPEDLRVQQFPKTGGAR